MTSQKLSMRSVFEQTTPRYTSKVVILVSDRLGESGPRLSTCRPESSLPDSRLPPIRMTIILGLMRNNLCIRDRELSPQGARLL